MCGTPQQETLVWLAASKDGDENKTVSLFFKTKGATAPERVVLGRIKLVGSLYSCTERLSDTDVAGGVPS